ncbi:MAG: hypothetical protein M3Q22_01725 [Actinomycetota bacterium]|nr:hypothetical protein [Actinomycetota bacterium]
MIVALQLDDRPGGTNTSHTIAVDLLTSLLAATPPTATGGDYERVAVEENVLGRATRAGRARTFRYLRELYLLDPTRLLFRALRDLWDEDVAAQPLLACLTALVRDSAFRATSHAVLSSPVGASVDAGALTGAVVKRYPDVYNVATAAKIGRNTASSWTQSGHLEGRSNKRRRRPLVAPSSTTLSLLLGHLSGLRGEALFSSSWARVLDVPPEEVRRLAADASRRRYLELKDGGGVVEIGFRHLLRPPAERIV